MTCLFSILAVAGSELSTTKSTSEQASPVPPVENPAPQAPAYTAPAHHVLGVDPLLCDLAQAQAAGDDWQAIATNGGALVENGRVLVQVDANLQTNVYERSAKLREPFLYSVDDLAATKTRFPAATLVEMGSATRFRAWVDPAEIVEFRNFVALFQPETVVFAWHPESATYGSVNSEGPNAMGVSGYPSPTPTGNGIKVGVIDVGFAGVNTTAAAEVGSYTSPQANVHTGTQVHGTACAEIIRDAAPNCELRLYNLALGMTFMQATQDAITWGADVLSVSLGSHGYPGEGDGPDAARLADQNGILWCNSAGNHGYREYWEKQTPVVNTNTYVEQSPGVTLNQLNTSGASSIWVTFANEQPTGSYAHFQVQIFADSGSGPTVVAQGTAGASSQSVIYSSLQGGTTYYIGIRRSQAGTVGKMRFFMYDGGSLAYYSNQGSIVNPATLDSEVITVGAVNYSGYNASGSPTYYSSRGGGIFNMPLDFCAPTQCSTISYGSSGFNGTSCSCPNTAGLMALQLSHTAFQGNPVGTLTLVNLGVAGWDADSGWGIVKAPTTGGGSSQVLYQNQPVLVSPTPTNITITPQQYFWNAVAVTSPASTNWNLQMSTVTATAGAGVCDFLVANGNKGNVSNAGILTRPSGTAAASVEHAGLTSMPAGGSAGFDFSGGHTVHLWELQVPLAGTYPISVYGSASADFRWYVYGPGSNSDWKGASSASYGPFATNTGAQSLSLASADFWAVVVVLDNGATSTETIFVDVGNPLLVPTIFVSQSSLNLAATSQGVPGPTQSYTVGGNYLTGDIAIQAPLTVEMSLTGASGTWTPSLLLPQSGGTVPQTTIYTRIAASAAPGSVSGSIVHTSAGATTQNVSVSGTVNPPATPTIVVSTTSLDLGATTQGSAGPVYSYTASGTNLTADITVTAPSSIQVSLSAASGFGSSVTLTRTGGTVSTTSVYARIGASHPAGNVTGSISHTSAGATTKNVALSGVVVVAGSGAITISRTSLDLGTCSPPTFGDGGAFHYWVEGSGLVADIVITAPAYTRLSKQPGTFSTQLILPRTGSNVAPTKINVEIDLATYTGAITGDITHTSTGATTELLAVTGQSIPNFSPVMILDSDYSPCTPPTTTFGTIGSVTTFRLFFNYMAAGPIHLVAPTGVEIGNSSSGEFFSELFIQQSGQIGSGNIYIRMSADFGPGFVSGEITATAAGVPMSRAFVEGVVQAASGPTIAVNQTAMAVPNTGMGTPTHGRQYHVAATGLTANLTITAPTDMQVSATGGIGSYSSAISLTPIGGTVPSTFIYARLSPTAVCTGTSDRLVYGNVTHASTGATTKSVLISATLDNRSGCAILLSTNAIQLGSSEVGQPGTGFTYTVAITPQTQGNGLTIVASPEIEVGFGVTPSVWDDVISFGPSTTPQTVSVRARAGTPEGLIEASIRHYQPFCGDQSISVTGDIVAATTTTVFIEPPVYSHSLSASAGTASSSVAYGVRGYSLSTDLVVTAPAGLEVSLDNQTFSASVAVSPTAGAVPLMQVYARIHAAASVGNVGGTIVHSSAGATSKSITVTGLVYAAAAPAIFCDLTHIQFPVTEQSTNGTPIPVTITCINCTNYLLVNSSSQAIEVSLNGLNWSSGFQTAQPVAGVFGPAIIYVRRSDSSSQLGLHSPGFIYMRQVGTTPLLNIPCSVFNDAHGSSLYSVTSPNGGEAWQAGSTQTITWTHDAGTPGSVSIELSGDSGATWTDLITPPVLASQLSFDWAIPSSAPPGTTYRVRVRRNFYTSDDGSDADFTITAAATPLVQVTQASLNLGTTTVGTSGSPAAYDVDGSNLGTIPITITPPAGVEIRNASAAGTFSSNAILLMPSGGVVPTTTIEVRISASASIGQAFNDLLQVSGQGSQDIILMGTVDPPPPGISLSTNSLNLGTVTQGTTGTAQSWLVTGSNLTQDITVTPPSGVEIRNTSGGAFTSSAITLTHAAGAVSETLEARIAATATSGQGFGDITHASGSATNDITLTGTVLPPPSLNATPNSLNLGTTIAGTAGATIDSYTLSGANLVANVTVTPPAGVEIRDAAGGTFAASALVIVPSAGSVNVTVEARIASGASAGATFTDITNVSGAVSDSVAVTGTVLPPPNLNVNPATVDLGTVLVGTTGTTVDSYVVTGANLLANVTITPPADIEIRDAAGGTFGTSALTIVPSSASVNVTIEARIASTASAGQSFGSITNASGSQNSSVTITGSVVTPILNVNPTTLNLGTTSQGAPGTPASYAVTGSDLTANVTITPPSDIEIRDAAGGTFGTTALTIVPSAGSVSVTIEARIAASATSGQAFGSITNVSASLNGSVSLSGTVTPPVPVINLTPTGLNLGSVQEGTPSAPMTYAVDGANLTADITITPPSGIEIRLLPAGVFASTPIVLTQSGGTVAATDIEVRIAAAAIAGQVFAPITHVSGTAASDLTLSGTVSPIGGGGGDGGGDDGGGCAGTQSSATILALLALLCTLALLRRTRPEKRRTAAA